MAKPKNNPSRRIHVVNNNTAGIDIGSRKIFVGIADKLVVSYDTFTDDFLHAITYLKENNITSVAMEATGVYWISLYDILDQAGFDVVLVKADQAKNIPGRKTDVADCQWTCLPAGRFNSYTVMVFFALHSSLRSIFVH